MLPAFSNIHASDPLHYIDVMNEEFVTLSRANLPVFADLYQSVFNAPPWNDGWIKEAATERLTTFADFPTFRGMGILHEEIPIAFVLGWGERWVQGWVFHVKEMCVHSDWQRRGLGRELMTAFESQLSREGFRSVELQTGEKTPARSFYESHGYRQMGLVSLHKKLRQVANA